MYRFQMSQRSGHLVQSIDYISKIAAFPWNLKHLKGRCVSAEPETFLVDISSPYISFSICIAYISQRSCHFRGISTDVWTRYISKTKCIGSQCLKHSCVSAEIELYLLVNTFLYRLHVVPTHFNYKVPTYILSTNTFFNQEE